jgi:hypothetical protein
MMTPEERFERIEANLDLVVDQIALLGNRVDKTSATVEQLADIVASLVRNGYAGKGRKRSWACD